MEHVDDTESVISAGKDLSRRPCRCAIHNSAELRETCCVCHCGAVMEADHECSDFAALGAIISNIRLL